MTKVIIHLDGHTELDDIGVVVHKDGRTRSLGEAIINDNGVTKILPEEVISPPPPIVEDGINREGMTSLSLSPVARGTFNTGDWDNLWESLGLSTWFDDNEGNLSIETVAGSTALESAHVPNGDNGSVRINSGGRLSNPVTDLTIVERVYLPSGYDFGSHPSNTQKMGFGIRSTVDASGGEANPEGFSSRFQTRLSGGQYVWGAYVYEANTADFGDDYLSDVVVQTDQWVELAMRVKMNTAYGTSDGILQMWVDGVLKVSLSNINWLGQRADGEPSVPSIEGLSFNSFHGGSGDSRWKPASTQYPAYSDIAYKSGAPVKNTVDGTVEITNGNTVLSDGNLTATFNAADYPDGTRIDMWIKHPSINNGVATDIASSVAWDKAPAEITSTIDIPKTGADFQIGLRVAQAPFDFAGATDSAVATYTSAPALVLSGDSLSIEEFCFNSINTSIRNYYGIAASNYGAYSVPNIPSNVTYSPTSQSQAQSFINSMQPGQVLKLPNNANGWTLNLDSTSGSNTSKKHIIGSSDADGSGAQTSNTIRFNIDGDHWMISGIEVNRSGSSGRIATITGSYNVFYNIRNTNNELAVLAPKGGYMSPGTVGNRFVRCYNQGPGHSDTNSGISFRDNYANANGSTCQDTLIAGCVFKDYGAIGANGSGKAVTNVSWFWTAPFYEGPDAPGPPERAYMEIVGCHFIDCVDETLTMKTDWWWVHDNLFESDNAGHISLRSCQHSHIHSNICITNAGTGIRLAGSNRDTGYFNVCYSGNNGGIGISHAALNSTGPFGSSSRFPRRLQNYENDFRHNFLLGPGSSAGMLRYLFDSSHMESYPTRDNLYKDNVYVGPSNGIDVYGSSSAISDAGSNAQQSGFENNNPDSKLSDQIWSTRTTGNCFDMPSLVTMPTEIDTGDVWIDGRPIVARINPTMVGPQGLVIQTT